MKKFFTLIALAACLMTACSKGGDDSTEKVKPTMEDGLVFVENGVSYIGNGNQEFPAPVKDYVLDASKTYVLRGWVYVQEGSSITIPAGTVIKGLTDANVKGSSLIIEIGAKIYAQGTASKPIVFTSAKPAGQRKPGDWGGVIILGKARNNKTEMQIEGGPRSKHGGNNDADNSGIFSYCRIEFAGYPFQVDAEINGLTMGSVGSGTKIDHVQLSYANDDSFEWFGGAVSCSHLVAYHGWDDDYDTDNGFSGKLQFILGVRHPKIADQSLSNGFESDGNANGTTDAPLTTAQFCNVTLIGPIGQDPNFVNASGSGKYIDAGTMFPNNGSRVGQFQAGLQIRRSSNISVCNSVVVGYPVGLIIENDKASQTQAAASSRKAIQNVFFGGYTDNAAAAVYNNTASANTVLGSDKNKTWKDALSTNASTVNDVEKSFSHSYILLAANKNTVKPNISDLGLKNPISLVKDANYGPKSGSILVNSALTVPAGFDTKGNGYAGAFKSDAAADNWMAGWTNFDPQNTAY